MKPLRDRLLVKVSTVPGLVSEGGIEYADTVAASLAPQQGEVMATGDDVAELGVGTHILFGLGSGEDVLLSGQAHVLIPLNSVICRVT